MDSNRITKATPVNPRERADERYPADVATRKVGAGAKAMAQEGYAILDRADVKSRYHQGRDGLTDPESPTPRIYED